MQLLTYVVPAFEQLKKEYGRRKDHAVHVSAGTPDSRSSSSGIVVLESFAGLVTTLAYYDGRIDG